MAEPEIDVLTREVVGPPVKRSGRRPGRVGRIGIWLVLLGALAGGRLTAQVDEHSRRSATVTNSAPLLAPGAWQVAATALTYIGVAEGAEEYALTNVVAASVDASGSIALVLNSPGMSEIRLYDSAGQYIRTAAGHGDGPGEFRILEAAYRVAGDSILGIGFDLRYALFSKEGVLGRTGASLLGFPVTPVGLVRPGGLLVWRIPASDRPRSDTRLQVEYNMFLLLDLETGEADTLSVLPSYRTYYGDNTFLPQPFSPSAHAAASPGHVWLGNSDANEVSRYAVNGALELTIQNPMSRVPVTRSDRRRFQAHLTATLTGNARRLFERQLGGVDYPSGMPYFDDLKTDRVGNLWVRQYAPPWAAADHNWRVFSPQGVWITDVLVPSPVFGQCGVGGYSACDPILEIADKHMVIKHVDDLGVVRVGTYELRKRTPR